MKTIHYPGNFGQRCEAEYIIDRSPAKRIGLLPRTALVIIEKINNPGDTFCTNHSMPTLLVCRILNRELPECALELIDIFYACLPEADGHRDIAEWLIVWPTPQGEQDIRLYPPVDGIPFSILHQPLPSEEQEKIRSLLSNWEMIK